MWRVRDPSDVDGEGVESSSLAPCIGILSLVEEVGEIADGTYKKNPFSMPTVFPVPDPRYQPGIPLDGVEPVIPV